MSGCFHIVVAMKPVEDGFVENAFAFGVAGINVDGCRVESEPVHTTRNIALGSSSGGIYHVANTPGVFDSHPKGRWPANVVLGHAEGCVLKGTKKVKAITGGKGIILVETNFGQTSNVPQQPFDYADADGKETVADWDCMDGCPVRGLGEQSGESVSHDAGMTHATAEGWGHKGERLNVHYAGDTGTAARFFKQVNELEVDE